MGGWGWAKRILCSASIREGVELLLGSLDYSL